MQRTLFYMARRRFFVDQVRLGRAQITGADAHHLTRVLRVEAGHKYEISDNERLYLAEVETARKELVTFAVIEELPVPEATQRVVLYASLIKFDRFELLIEKATELGVYAIVPVQADRSERGLDRAAVKRAERWHRIAREASEQSRRARLPEIAPIEPLLSAAQTAPGFRLMLEEEPGAPALLRELSDDPRPADAVSLLLGPEGGWTDRERAALREHSWHPVSLGSLVLRAETAAIAALAVVNAVLTNCASETSKCDSRQ